ncbi:MAG: FKBP-type peptidyl-prolyl cis-trans isomerase [Marinagarivorans sp.]|nr:FKBP-type peptidyl-prolyl cis-trans isomerase [Marinagarivorans sp.]
MTTLFSRKNILLAAAVSAALFTAGCNKPGAKEVAPVATASELTTLEQKVTYIVGFRMATQAKQGSFALDKAVMSMAIQDVADAKEARISQEDQQKIMMDFQTEQEAKHQAEASKLAAENLEKGKAYLAENAKKEGVKVTASGLQYKLISAGAEGSVAPKAEDSVKVHYHGTLVDGTVFDSSKDRGEPVTFPVSGVIQGWVEGLQLMKTGDKMEFYIPSDLAYGENGPGSIGPNAVLTFEVELIEVNPEAPHAEAPHADAEAKPAK